MAARGSLPNRLAFSATAHCLTGCAIGEVLGMVIGTALGWGDFATIALAVVLAFFFAYSPTMVPLLGSGLRGLLFWGSLAFALGVAFVAAFPANRWLIARSRGHAVVHQYYGGHQHNSAHEGH